MIGNRSSRTLKLAAVLAALLSSTAVAADTFYQNLLDEGRRAHERGEHRQAVEQLRIACFGFLDEPRLLTQGLMSLGLAQAAVGDRNAFGETFSRLTSLEERFGSYSALAEDGSLRLEFERVLPTLVSDRALARVSVFAALLARREAAQAKALPVSRRMKELAKRLKADPLDGPALLELTRLEVADGQTRKARKRVDRLLVAQPEHATARCIRGQMLLRDGQCSVAVADLDSCSAAPTDAASAPVYLQCLTSAGDWKAARRYVETLPEGLRIEPAVAALAALIPNEEPRDVVSLRPATFEAEVQPSPAAAPARARVIEERDLPAARTDASAQPPGDATQKETLPREKEMVDLQPAERRPESLPPRPSSIAPSTPPKPSAIETFVRAWAAAWSNQSVGDYLGFYAPEFETPEGLSRRQWEFGRRQRLTSPSFIEVDVEILSWLEEGDTASVIFVQSYSSDLFSDRVRKQLDLQRSPSGWKIVRERTVS